MSKRLTVEQYNARQYKSCEGCGSYRRVCFKCGAKGNSTDVEVPIPYSSNTAQIQTIICYECQFKLIQIVREFLDLPIPEQFGE